MNENIFPTTTYCKKTPVGTIFVHTMEQNDKLVKVIVHAGKTGTEFAVYCDSLARLASKLIEVMGPDKGLDTILEELSNITSDRTVRNPNGVLCRSGAEGIYLCLLDYKRDKNTSYLDVDEDNYRPPRIGYNVA